MDNMPRAKSFFKKLADKIGFEPPKIEISPEREQEIIDKSVKIFQRWGMEDLAIVFLSGFAPTSFIFGYTVVLPWAPLLATIGFKNPWEYVAFFADYNNIQTIIKRLDKETRR